MSNSKIQKKFEIAEVTVNINRTGDTQVYKPSGWESSPVALLSASCYTIYDSVVDYTYDNFAYFGDLRISENPMIFTPKNAGNVVKITFILAKINAA